MRLRRHAAFVGFAFLAATACGELAPLPEGAKDAPADAGSVADSGGPADPPRCSDLGEPSGTQVTVVDKGFAPEAFSVAENCAGIHLVAAAKVVACPYVGCAAGGVSGKEIGAVGTAGYGIVSANNRVYVARSSDPATAGVFATSMDLQEPWEAISQQPTQRPPLRRFHGQALGEVTVDNGYFKALLYPTRAGGAALELAGDYGGDYHLAQYFSTFGADRAFYRGHAQIPVLYELAAAPAVAVLARGPSRLSRGVWVLATATRVVSIEKIGTDFGVLSCPQTELGCRDAMSATAPIARGVYGPFYAAHGRIYALRSKGERAQVLYWDDAALAGSDLTGTPLGAPLPFGSVFDFDADDDHLYVRGAAQADSASVVRIAK